MTTAGTALPFDPIALGTEIQRRIGVKTSRDEPLARFTTMRVGGPADLFAVAHNAFELRALVKFVRSRGIPHVVLGRGSDVVIADAGVRGLVIQVRAEGTEVVDDRLVAEAGVPMARAATVTQAAGLSGLEFGLAIPGTAGGAVWANAGAHESDVRAILDSALVMTADGSEARLDGDGLELGYRDSRLKHARPIDPAAGADRGRRHGRPGRGRRDRDVPARAGLAGRHPRPSRRDPPLAPGPPAARHAECRLVLPEPGRRLGRPADRGGRAEGQADRRCLGQREARQLPDQRQEGHGDRRPEPGRAGPGRGRPAIRASSSRPRSSSSATGARTTGTPAPMGDAVSGCRRPSAVRAPSSTPGVRSSSCSAVRRPSTTSRSSRATRSATRSRTRAIPSSGCSSTSRAAGGGCRPGIRSGLALTAYDDPVGLDATGPEPTGQAVDRLAAARPAAGRVHRPPRAVRRGRHDPGDPRGGRPRLHRLGRHRLGGRAWTRRSSSGWPAASACRSADWREVTATRWAADRTAVLGELEAFAAGDRRSAPDGQAGPARAARSG